MDPIDFEGSNRVLKGGPPSVFGEQVSDLHVLADESQSLSCWQMSWRERFEALFFGRIWVGVLFGGNQPPIWLATERDGKPRAPTHFEGPVG